LDTVLTVFIAHVQTRQQEGVEIEAADPLVIGHLVERIDGIPNLRFTGSFSRRWII
jgi:hypothetical protein